MRKKRQYGSWRRNISYFDDGHSIIFILGLFLGLTNKYQFRIWYYCFEGVESLIFWGFFVCLLKAKHHRIITGPVARLHAIKPKSLAKPEEDTGTGKHMFTESTDLITVIFPLIKCPSCNFHSFNKSFKVFIWTWYSVFLYFHIIYQAQVCFCFHQCQMPVCILCWSSTRLLLFTQGCTHIPLFRFFKDRTWYLLTDSIPRGFIHSYIVSHIRLFSFFNMELLKTAILHEHTSSGTTVYTTSTKKKEKRIALAIHFLLNNIWNNMLQISRRELNSAVESICCCRSDWLQVSQAAKLGSGTWINVQKKRQRIPGPLDSQDTAPHHNVWEHGQRDARH